MPDKFIGNFLFIDWGEISGYKNDAMAAAEKYRELIVWAGQARGRNPREFDALTGWILDDSEWGADKLAGNEQLLMAGVIARFREQNGKLRDYLKELEPSGVVNAAVFKALDRFDDELSGAPYDERMREAVAKVFADFSAMSDRGGREVFAGDKTGPEGVDYVELYGFVNSLKDCDAGVQWALFMPDAVERQQKGFKVETFEYRDLPAMRFIGRETGEDDGPESRMEVMRTLDAMPGYKSGFDYDLLFMHHYGKNVDVERWHGFWGRFMKAGAPVPDGFEYFDFIEKRDVGSFAAGPPYISQVAYATFTGDMEAMHTSEGFDSDAMYDVTRNIMLGQGVNIPYPDKYWTAEVFPDGCDKHSTAYLFSA